MIKPGFIKHYLLLATLVTSLLVHSSLDAKKKKKVNFKKRWEQDISKFEMMDKENPPVKNPILFIGGSNFRRWDLKQNFPELPVLNRAFGGSMISEAIHFIDRIVYPYNPKTIVLYGGANDMSRGRKNPAQVLESYLTFVKLVHKKFPKSRIIYISLPHFYRHRDLPDKIANVKKVNKLIQEETKKDDRLDFAEINKAMEDKQGNPRKDLFTKDGVHVNQAGYDVWAEKLRPFMIKD